jgi:hypothetical protein
MRSTMTAAAKLEALRSASEFAAGDDADLVHIAAAAHESVVAPGTVLVREGQRGGSPSYLILSGEASVEADVDGRGARRVGPGTLVGALAADPYLRANTATAVTLMHLLAIEPERDRVP